MHTRGFYPEVIIESEVGVRPRLITPHGDLDYFVYHKKESNSCLIRHFAQDNNEQHVFICILILSTA